MRHASQTVKDPSLPPVFIIFDAFSWVAGNVAHLHPTLARGAIHIDPPGSAALVSHLCVPVRRKTTNGI